MSAKILGKVWDLDLPHNKLLVLLALADHADHEGGSIRPSLGLVAWKTGYSEQQCRRIMRALEKDGILVATKRAVGKVTHYRIRIEAGNPKPPFRDETPDILSPLPKSNPLHSCVTPTPDILTLTPDIAMSDEPSLEPSIEPSDSAPIGAGTSPDWISQFFQALAAFAQAELERDPAFEAICRELFGIEHTTIQDKSTRGRINGLASTARNNFQAVYEQHFADGWTRDLEEKLARAISAFVKSWKATHADTAVPLARDKFGTAFLKFLQTYKPDRKPAPAPAAPVIHPLTPEERAALAEARKAVRPAWEQTGEPLS